MGQTKNDDNGTLFAALIIGVFVVVLLYSILEEIFIAVSNFFIETLTPTGISIVVSIFVIISAQKYLREQLQLLASIFFKKNSTQKKVVLPFFALALIGIAFVKFSNMEKYTDGIKKYYEASNKFVEDTSIYRSEERKRTHP